MNDRQAILQEFFENIVPFQRCLRSEKEEFFNTAGTSRNHIELLYLLRHHEPQSVKDISEHFGTTSSAATQAIEAADKLGHVERVSSDKDRRSSLISLTPAGREYITSFKKKHFEYMAQKFDSITDEEFTTLIHIHKKIMQAIKDRHTSI